MGKRESGCMMILTCLIYSLRSWCSRSISSTSSSAWCSSVRLSGSPSVSTYRFWLITCGGGCHTHTEESTVFSLQCLNPKCDFNPPHVTVLQVYEQTCHELSRTLRPNNYHECWHPGILSKRRLVQTGFLSPVVLLLSLWVCIYFYILFNSHTLTDCLTDREIRVLNDNLWFRHSMFVVDYWTRHSSAKKKSELSFSFCGYCSYKETTKICKSSNYVELFLLF